MIVRLEGTSYLFPMIYMGINFSAILPLLSPFTPKSRDFREKLPTLAFELTTTLV